MRKPTKSASRKNDIKKTQPKKEVKKVVKAKAETTTKEVKPVAKATIKSPKKVVVPKQVKTAAPSVSTTKVTPATVAPVASSDNNSSDVILSVRHLKQFFRFGSGIYKYNKAVHDVSFDIHRGEVLGLVGESGCGKTTTGRSIIKLYDITSGSIYFEGVRTGAGTRWNEKEIKFKRKKARAKIESLEEEKKDKIENLDASSDTFDEEKSQISTKYDTEIAKTRSDLEALVKVQKKEIALAKHDNKYCNKDFAKQKTKEVLAKYLSIANWQFKGVSLNIGCYQELSKFVTAFAKKKLSYSNHFDKEKVSVNALIADYLKNAKAYLDIDKHAEADKKAFVSSLCTFPTQINALIDQSSFDDVDMRTFETLDRGFAGLVEALPIDADSSLYSNKKMNYLHFVEEYRIASHEKVTNKMQMIFQDPIASLDPRMTVKEIIAEGLRIRGIKNKDYINKRVNDVLKEVGLLPEHSSRYPHEFSGGQRQRIGIARALVMDPDLIIADEPISALDVSIQAQVINLLNDLRKERNLTILFIAHDLSVVKYFCDRIAVMYFGNLVELAPSDVLFKHPLHPYTRSLLSAIPLPDPHYEKNRKRIEYNPMKDHDYSVEKPTLREVEPGHFVRCSESEFKKYQGIIKGSSNGD